VCLIQIEKRQKKSYLIERRDCIYKTLLISTNLAK
jgi:hypothetical protein